MVGEHSFSRSEKSPDELWAERAIEAWSKVGFYVECGGKKTLAADKWEYYALVMPREEFDELLIEINYKARKIWESNQDLKSREFTPREDLPWYVKLEQKTFVDGMPSRRAALLAAAEPYI